jgi:hypothetical protein
MTARMYYDADADPAALEGQTPTWPTRCARRT